jgi:hypothetical protein
MYATDVVHGGKITCHKCGEFLKELDEKPWFEYDNGVYFHTECFSKYDHYYGLDKPID